MSSDILASAERRRAAVKEIEKRVALINTMIDVQRAIGDRVAYQEVYRLTSERDKLIHTLAWVK